MGVSINLRTYLAVEAPLSAFFEDTGEYKRVCTRNSDHEVRDAARFCEHCGGQIQKRAIKRATPLFMAFCEKEKASPSKAFYLLKREGWEWSDTSGETSYTLHWVDVQLVSASAYDQAESEKVMALGFHLNREDVKDRQSGVMSYSPEVFSPSQMKALEEVAESFGLEASPKLYVQVEYC